MCKPLVQNGHIQSTAIMPRKTDNCRLSTYDSEHFTPETAFNHYQSDAKVGVLHITKADCDDNKLTIDQDDYGFVGHVSVIFDATWGRSQIERVAKILTRRAISYGWDYPPGLDIK